MSRRCATCGLGTEPTFFQVMLGLTEHRCPPSFQVWDPKVESPLFKPGDEYSNGKVYAVNAEFAARRWVARRDEQDDHPAQDPGGRVVMVRSADGSIASFRVRTVTSVDYYALEEPLASVDAGRRTA